MAGCSARLSATSRSSSNPPHLRQRREHAVAHGLPVLRRVKVLQLQPVLQQRVAQPGERRVQRPRVTQRQHAEAEVPRAVGRKIQVPRLVEEEIHRHPALLVVRAFGTRGPLRIGCPYIHTPSTLIKGDSQRVPGSAARLSTGVLSNSKRRRRREFGESKKKSHNPAAIRDATIPINKAAHPLLRGPRMCPSVWFRERTKPHPEQPGGASSWTHASQQVNAGRS